MWNEGFEYADLPWCRVYTEDIALIHEYRDKTLLAVTTANFDIPDNFRVNVCQAFHMNKVLFNEELEESKDYFGNDTENETNPLYSVKDRILWGVGKSQQEMMELIESRLQKWNGV